MWRLCFYTTTIISNSRINTGKKSAFFNIKKKRRSCFSNWWPSKIVIKIQTELVERHLYWRVKNSGVEARWVRWTVWQEEKDKSWVTTVASAILKQCWLLTDQAMAPTENRRQLLISLQSLLTDPTHHQLGGISDISSRAAEPVNAQQAVFWWQQTTESENAGSAELRRTWTTFVSRCRACEASSSSCCCSVTQHFWIVTNQTGCQETSTHF